MTRFGGAVGGGTVLEIAKTAGGYASTPTDLVSFQSPDGEQPQGSLIADANGDLFGTTTSGGASNDGTVFEVKKTAGGYASAPTTLVSFDGDNGKQPVAGLVADANGDLFGTTAAGGPDASGTVFEIAKTPTGYSSTPATLVNFNITDGASPVASLIIDSRGDLFGTTSEGGQNGDGTLADGTVFEIKKTAAGYATTPITLVNFDGVDAFSPGSLIADANGDLFGTTPDGFAADARTALCLRSSKLPRATPALPPYWSTLTCRLPAPTAAIRSLASSPTPIATCSVRLRRAVSATPTAAPCSRSPTAALRLPQRPRPRSPARSFGRTPTAKPRSGT